MDQFIVWTKLSFLVGNYEDKKMLICVFFRELFFLGTTVWEKPNR